LFLVITKAILETAKLLYNVLSVLSLKLHCQIYEPNEFLNIESVSKAEGEHLSSCVSPLGGRALRLCISPSKVLLCFGSSERERERERTLRNP